MKWTIELTDQELQLVLNALAEQPYRLSAPLIQTISKQAQDQQVKLNGSPEETPEPPTKKTKAEGKAETH
jgi:hypothetical protein